MGFTYEQAERAYRDNQIESLAKDESGLRFLFLRSLSRREHVEELAVDHGIDIGQVHARDRLRVLFFSDINKEKIIQSIKKIYERERAHRRKLEPALVSELYKMQAFDWGGLHQNSLEKTIVNNYVKKITSFSTLNDKIENELLNSMRGYVQCSWYNHWTSIIIEDIFKDHDAVLPAVGLIKKIDFFIRDVPFDLKVTYLPEGYIKDKRREANLRPEITELRRLARALRIHFDNELSESKLLEDLWLKVSDNPTPVAQEGVATLVEARMKILKDCIEDPAKLIVWLYENQGERRFDASNRLFVVLVNTANFFASWKLKRARDLLVNEISHYLDNAAESPGMQIAFVWEGDQYTATSDTIFITHQA